MINVFIRFFYPIFTSRCGNKVLGACCVFENFCGVRHLVEIKGLFVSLKRKSLFNLLQIAEI